MCCRSFVAVGAVGQGRLPSNKFGTYERLEANSFRRVRALVRWSVMGFYSRR